MISAEGEFAVFKGYTARGEVEDWFKALEVKMKSSLNGSMRDDLYLNINQKIHKGRIRYLSFLCKLLLQQILYFGLKQLKKNYIQANAEGDQTIGIGMMLMQQCLMNQHSQQRKSKQMVEKNFDGFGHIRYSFQRYC